MGGSGDGDVIDGTEPTATPEENDETTLGTNPITTIGNGSEGNGTNGGNSTDGTDGIGNTDMSAYDDAAKIIAELENKVATMTNREESDAAIDYRTDTDIINIVNGLPDGEEKDQLLSRLEEINKVLDDRTTPVISGINNGDVTKENVTINVTDENDVVITATLNGEAIEFTTPLTEEGKYVVTVTDKNFNESTVEFTIDKTAPTYVSLGITDLNEFTDEVGKLYVKQGDTVRVLIYFTEKLTISPIVKIGNQEFPATYREASSQNGQFAYYADIKITSDMNLEEGIISFEVYNYADKAGNFGVVLTEQNINNDTYPSVIYDSVAPVLDGLTDGMFTNQKISLKISDTNWDHIHVNQIGVREFDEYREWTGLLDDGIYELQAFDKAGNASEVITVTKDSVAPSMKVGDTVYVPDTTEVIYTNERFTADAIDELSGIDKIYANGHERPRIDVSGESSYTFTLVDKAGNESKFYVVIDKTAPAITKVPDGQIVNWSVSPRVEDTNLATVTLTKDDVVVEGYQDNMYELSHEGVYVITAIDKAGNKTEMTFTIDKTAPVFEGLANGIYYDNDIIVNVLDDNLDTITAKVYADNYQVVELQNNTSLTKESIYYLTATDKAGNATSIYVAVDKTNPEITGFDNNSYSNQKEIVYISDNNLKTVTINGEVYSHDGKSFQKTLFTDGRYVVEATDHAGRTSTKTVTIDKTKPVFTNLVDGTVTNDKVSLTVDDANFDYILITNLDTGYSWKEARFWTDFSLEGRYSFTAYDKANNSSETYEVTIDKTAPTINLIGDEYIYLNYNNSYNELSANYSDGTLSTNIMYSPSLDGKYVETNSVDSTKAGYYKITYTATDNAGNSSSVVRTVQVFEENTIAISNSAELVEAIKNQKDGQTFLFVKSGTYDVNNMTDGSKGNYTVPSEVYNYPFAFPIYANNLVITKAAGVGEVVITSSYTPDAVNGGNWHEQNFITIYGNNVTIENVSLKGNINNYYGYCNKVIEILADNTVIKNVNILNVAYEFAGSIYVNKTGVNTTLENVNLQYGRISLSGADSSNTINLKKVYVDFANSQMETNYAFWNPNGAQVNSTNLTVTVSNHVLDDSANSMEEMLNMLPNNTTVIFSSGEYNVGSLAIMKSLTLKGSTEGTTIFNVDGQVSGQAAFYISKSGVLENFVVNMLNETSKIDAIKISDRDGAPGTLIDNYTIKNVVINGGAAGLNIHGVKNAEVSNVISRNALEIGISIASSDITINDTTVENGSWGSIGIMYTENSSIYPATSHVTIGNNVNVHSYIYAESFGYNGGNIFIFTNPNEWKQFGSAYYKI